jgi:predicted 2-oxoglutarate/Fe(II)-dependent dioxygenase YbiX
MYSVDRVIDDIDIEELLGFAISTFDINARVVSDTGNVVDTSIRDVVMHECHNSLFPELTQMLNSHYKANVLQFDLLSYGIGGHFIYHRDSNPKSETRVRDISTVTMLEKSNDLIGGDLVIDYDGVEHTVVLEVGDTVSFDSTLLHKVTPVEKGTRIVLVCWLNKVK